MALNQRIGTKVNLEEGGTHDLLIMGFPNGFPRGYVTFEITDTPRRITGVQKVVQVFLKCLLTTAGSDPIRPDAGTLFPDYAASSNIGSDIEELKRILRDEVKEAEKQTIRLLSSQNKDLSSQLASADILFANAVKDSITLGIKIVTRAGATASISIPFPQTDLAING